MGRSFTSRHSIALLCLLSFCTNTTADLSKRQGLSPPTGLPENWSYKGCYTDSVGQRSLHSATFASDDQSAGSCIEYCTSAGYSLAGTEYSRECFCGNSISAPGGPAPNGEGCNMACTGAPGEACGGPDRLSMYERTASAPAQSSAAEIDDGMDWVWTARGCYSDIPWARILSQGATVQGGGQNNSAQSCTAECGRQNFKYAGTEYAAECFCGNTLNNNHAPQDDGCNMRCNGDRTQFCGGPDRINIYEYIERIVPTQTPSSTSTPASSSTSTSEMVLVTSFSSSDISSVHVLTLLLSDSTFSSSATPELNASPTVSGSNMQSSSLSPDNIPISSSTSVDHYSTTSTNSGFSLSPTSEVHSTSSDDHSSTMTSSGQVPSTTISEEHISTVFPLDQPTSTSAGIHSTSSVSTSSLGVSGLSVSSEHSEASTSTEVFLSSSEVQSHSVSSNLDSTATSLSTSSSHDYLSTTVSTERPSSLPENMSSTSDFEHFSVSSSTNHPSESSSFEEISSTFSFDASASMSDDYLSLASSTHRNSALSASPTTFDGPYNSTMSATSSHSSNIASETLISSTPESLSGANSSSTLLSSGNFSATQFTTSTVSASVQSTAPSVQNISVSSDFHVSTVSSSVSNEQSSPITPEFSSSMPTDYSSSSTESIRISSPEVHTSATFSNYTSSTQSPPSITTTTLDSLSTSITLNHSATATLSDSSILLNTTSATPSPTPEPKTGWYYEGCYVDGAGGRSLPQGGAVQGPMTNEKCRTACRSQGFALAGTEYAGECYCGNALVAGGAPAPDGEALCNMPCNGNQTEICGGPNRLSLFRFYLGNEPPPSSTTATSSSAAPVATGLPEGFHYKGCYVDGPGYRVMQNQQPDDPAMTIASCSNKCADLGYDVAGMEYYTQCFCDKQLRMGAYLASDDTQCNTGCGGNSAQKCGGGDRLSVWSSQDTLKITRKPVPIPTVGNWTYQGCITSYGGGWEKPLPWKLFNATGNSPEWCLNRCAKYGYMAAGMEYGEECYCGDLDGVSASQKVPDTECTTPCPGEPEAICGQGNRLTWYKYTADEPLYVFSYPQGDAAGRYEFLVGSPVIPLIAQPLVNGKVSFLEKHGTGPNGTGAYELDPSIGGDIFHAFRELHGLRTDVFCAASLTMPDRAGRVINIGGWSADSLFGVRTYWPDGVAGINGTNDWQENYQEIRLQTTRWYPTSMIMPNGSMLIVGGENGSNGPPAPNMEILPRVGGLKHAQYLLDTDPFNLYPFLMVLPSGGIMIQFYNEARILDERTLDPIRILPKVPATVNDDTGGRTYPLEGTQVLLPQVYPYQEPLEVLICGGAGQAPAWGIDNCVTTQPDLPNPEWTIERMPSRRVLTCMTTLPDGTFLILNGAEEGAAGFGLADKSNFNAVLYDSRKPKHHRMSIMANTTIARMYHSEAVLLDDGRVLVSGSDPEDDTHPQEYRLEVFLPPYLTQNKPRPSFTIENKDWINDNEYHFQVSGSGGNIRVSLLGSEASTHGNSMGSRILFPHVHCSAWPTCTVTAPSGPYVAPPGWYRMFVLDDDVPSHATWVRIGGDPARLGDWPDTASFQPLPGVGPVRDLYSSQSVALREGGQKFRA